MRSHFAECMYEQGKINCGASPQADLIQNYFLWKRMFRKQNFRQNKGTFGTKTLVLALLDPFLNLFKEKFFFKYLWVKYVLPFPLSVATSSHPGRQDVTICAALCRGKILRKKWVCLLQGFE